MDKKFKILIVDDEAANIDVLLNVLSDDYETIIAKTGSQALKRTAQHQPDLILLDIVMPEMDGYEICRRLKADAQSKSIPVIFITAMTDVGDETKGLEIGAVDYITKPISPSIVRTRIKHHLERDRYRNHLEELVEARTRELNNSNQELMKAKEVAENANKIKSAFLRNMSHELRTPLNVILPSVQIALRYDMDPEIKEFLDSVYEQSKILLQLIDKVLDFSNAAEDELSLQASSFELAPLLHTLPKEFIHKQESVRIQVETNLDPALPKTIVGDHNRVRMIFIHLLENAAKFNENTPRALIGARLIDMNSEYTTIEFSLKDNGIGIATQDFEKIFEPFTQADDSLTRKYEGSGMGLSICRQIVALMGGNIWLESEVGQGSTFYFTCRFGNYSEG